MPSPVSRSVDFLELIKEARSDLAQSDTELFKIFLLAVMVGLRRREIDLLEWQAFHWDSGVIRIEPTRHFHPKSEDSIGDVAIDPELMEIFRGYRARAKSEFVIESSCEPKANVLYHYYRGRFSFGVWRLCRDPVRELTATFKLLQEARE